MLLPSISVLEKGVLREAISEPDRIVFWLPGKRENGFQFWERVGSVPHAEIGIQQKLCAIPATSISARQRVGGLLGSLLGRIRKTVADQAWLLPNGASAEQCGARQTDLLLVWPQQETELLDDARIRSVWPQAKRLQRIGKNLFLVSGIQTPGTDNIPMPPPGNPREQAEYLLALAGRGGDRRGEAMALSDLGALAMNEGNAQQALTYLERAVAIASELEDRSLEADALGNLGMAALRVGQRERAQPAFDQELRYARADGDRYVEKLALQHLGYLYESLRDPERAAAYFDEALVLTRALGDHQQEAALLWHLGIQHAELGRRQQAIALGQAAVDLLARLEKPEAVLFEEHLQKYRLDETDNRLGGVTNPQEAGWVYGGSIVAAATAEPSVMPPEPQQAASGPGLLRMALSAARSMGKFLGSGLKTASADMVHKRLRTCAACQHHTGVRCRVCGCFTNVKARMHHEDCPIGKWPKKTCQEPLFRR